MHLLACWVQDIDKGSLNFSPKLSRTLLENKMIAG